MWGLSELVSFISICISYRYILFFFNDTATTEIYTLSLHDALPIFEASMIRRELGKNPIVVIPGIRPVGDRKSTRLNSSHSQISYAVFCLKKKKIPHLDWRRNPRPGPSNMPPDFPWDPRRRRWRRPA